jgi:hypothetical protein
MGKMEKANKLTNKTGTAGEKQFAFQRQNYILLIAGLVILGIGFLLMIGGGSEDPNVFSDALFDFQRLTLAPILLLIGYIVEIFAILYRPKAKQ